ncbi:MAG: response regulator transcription factor [Ignavibacteriaceae bacterium]
MKRLNIYIFSSVPFIIEGIKHVLKSRYLAVSECSDVYELTLKRIEDNPPDIIFADDSCQDKDEFCSFIKSLLKLQSGLRTIMYTGDNDAVYLTKLIDTGIRGLLYKKAPKEKFFEAIETINKGGVYYDNLINFIISEYKISHIIKKDQYLEELSKKEKEILKLISCGFKNGEIADMLYISKGTVQVHKTNLLRKLNLKSTTELTIFAVSNKSELNL